MMHPTRDVLDAEALERLNRIGGQEFVVEMIELFLDNAPARLTAARAAGDSGDHRALYRAAHSLKSTAANLGAHRLQAVAERLEALAAGEESAGVEALLDEMNQNYALVRDRLDAERKRRQAPEDPTRGQT